MPNIEELLNLTQNIREYLKNGQLSKVEEKIQVTIEESNYEAFHWIVATIEEQYDNKNLNQEICIILGNQIRNYNLFIENIEIKQIADPIIQIVSDKNKEVESFFHILIRSTKYKYLYLVSKEKYDLKDNDAIEYVLLFTNHIESYKEKLE